ncbi:hypothetical protein [Micromonospora sp. NPDC000668]|uniref:hypothetical protein n=1 Tax=Micromonospora sp. NPDC000668 TaxID=3364219 RepID=UPI0036A1A293
MWPEVTTSLRNLVQANLVLTVPNIAALVDQLRLEHYPPNWLDDLRIRDVRVLADEEGIPLCWVPRADVITALSKANPERRRDVLLEHHAGVLEDCTLALVEVTAPELAEYARAAGEVMEAMQAGFNRPAEAYAMKWWTRRCAARCLATCRRPASTTPSSPRSRSLGTASFRSSASRRPCGR